MSASTSLRPFPTLNILCGGLGTAMGLTVLQLLGDESQHHRFLSIDSDTLKREADPTAARGIVDTLRSLQDRITVCRLAGFNLPQYRETYDDILAGRYPQDPPSSSQLGFAKMRIWGSLGGLAMAEQIRRAILTQVTQVRRVPNIDAQVIVVNIIAGLCGGTGSANIAKIAAIAYNALEETFSGGNVKIQYRIWGVTPDAYAVADAVRPVVERNGLMAIRELAYIQQNGWDLVIPDGSGQKVISVPAGFIDRLTLVSSYNAKTQLDETGAMNQVATAIVVGSDPRMAAVQQEEWIDIRPRFDARKRFVTAVGAYMGNVHNNSADLAGQLLRRNTAGMLLRLPVVPGSEVTSLRSNLMPTMVDALKAETKGVRPAVAATDVLTDPSKAVDTVLAEIADKRATLSGQVGSRVVGNPDAVDTYLALASRHNLGSLGAGLRTVAGSLQLPIPTNKDETQLREELRALGLKVSARKAWESSNWLIRKVTNPKVEGSDEVIEETSEELADQWVGLVLGYWNKERDVIIATAFNQATGPMAANLNLMVGALNQRHRELQDLAAAEIRVEVNVGNHNPYIRKFSFRPEDVEPRLPRVNLGELLQGHNLLTTTMGTILTFAGETVSASDLLLSHEGLRTFLAEALEAEPFLSYSNTASAGNSEAGGCDHRGYIMGPAALFQHPMVRDLIAADKLRWVGDDEDCIRVIHEDFGITPGSVSGVQAWEGKAAAADLTLAVSDLKFLEIPSLIEVRESVIAPIFLLAMLLGKKTPSGTADAEHPWRHLVAPDAKLQLKSGRWIYFPYPTPGGATARELGTTYRRAWQAFAANVGNVRDQMRRYVGDIEQDIGKQAVKIAIERFKAAVETEIRSLDEEFTATPDDLITDGDEARARKAKREHLEDLQWFSRTASNYLDTMSRTRR